MENTPRWASEAQIKKLQSLGYNGDASKLTIAEASIAINQLMKGNAQPQFNDGCQQHQGFQPQQPKPQSAPQQAPMVQQNTSYTITTRAGEQLDLSPQIVEAYICKDLTPAEYNYFFSICKTYELNPLLKDIYAIKFGSQPATFVIDYKVMQQAADNNPAFDGLKVGIIYLDKNGTPQEREGAYILPGETLIAGWCDVFRKDRTHANRTYALYSENVKTNNKGEVNTNWANKPVFMCVKVAKAQALRETFPNMFSNNTYTVDEMPERDEENIINSDYEESNIKDVKAKQKKNTASKTIAPEDMEEWPE